MISTPASDYRVSVVQHAHDTATTDESFRSIIGDISTGWWKKEVDAVRLAYAQGGKAAADGPKRQLPAVLFSGTFSRRSSDALLQHSGLICVDLDHLNERLPSIREAIEADPHTLAAFVSPTGSGLKVVFRCDPQAEHLQSYRAAERYCLENFGLEVDPACKDVSRLCFVSYDPETFVAESAIPLEILPEPVKHQTPHETKPAAHLTAGAEPWDDYDLRCDLPSLLRAHGWTECGKHGWTRPGKTSGVSATWNKVPGRFFVFTSSTEFEANHVYRPWHVYAILEHGGNWSNAVARLRKAGFGAQQNSQSLRKSSTAPEIYDPGYEEAANGHGQNGSSLETPPKAVKPFTLWAPSQFMAYQPDPSACLLGTGYLEMGQWTSLIGIGGLGKTRLALWLVICQMLKRPWCGLPTNGQVQKAVIFSTENGLRRWKEDLTKIIATLKDEERAVVEANLRILAMTDDEDADLNLGVPENVLRLKETITAAVPGILVLDPFADMVDGDENKTVDLVQTITTLRSITRSTCPKAAVLIIHHGRTGSANVAQAGDNFNAGNFGRGAKALYSKVRCELQLAPEDRDNPNRLVLACGKANDTVKFAPRCLVFSDDDFSYSVDPHFDIDAWRDDVSGNRKKSSVTIADLVEALREKCPLPGDEIATTDLFEVFEGAGVTKRTLQRHVANAVEAGYLRIGKKRFMLRLGHKPLPKK